MNDIFSKGTVCKEKVDNTDNRKVICLIGDVPPPFSGPEIGMQKLLRSNLKKYYKLDFFSFGLNVENVNRGKISIAKVLHFSIRLIQFYLYLNTNKPAYVYYYFAQTELGFIKDAIIINIAKLGRRKLILHLRGSNFRNFYMRQNKYIRLIIKSNLNKGDQILVQSECLKGLFKDIVGIDKLHVLYNGLEENEMVKDVTIKDRSEYNVLFLGILAFSKGYYDLIKAIPIVVKQFQNVKFNFAGEIIPLAAERNIKLKHLALPKMPQQLSIEVNQIIKEYENHINFLGVIKGDKKKEVFEASDLFVLPTYSEGFSNSILESMGYGLPVITTPVGANKDIFADTPEILVEPGNYTKLADNILMLLINISKREQYGKFNYNLVKHKYNMNIVVKQFMEAIEKIS
jgi:glycosyltransferase involved in cell wall biosynthesis